MMKAKVSKAYLVVIAVLTAIATTVALTSCHKNGEGAKHKAASAFSATRDAAQAPPKGSGSAKLTESDLLLSEAFGDPTAKSEADMTG